MHAKTLAVIEDEARLREYMEAYLVRGGQSKVALYTKALQKMVILDSFRFMPTWSWWGLFVGNYWLFYRRFYLLGFVIGFIFLLPSFYPSLMTMPTFVIPSLILVFALPLAVKYLVVKRFIETLDMIFSQERTLGEEEIKEVLAKMGGASRLAATLAVILTVSIGLLAEFFRHLISAFS